MATARDVFWSEAFITGVKQSALWIALGGALLHYISSFEKIFKDFGYNELPAMTVAVLTLGHFFAAHWYLGLLLILLWPLVNWGVERLVSPSPIAQELWHVATWTFPFLCAAMVAFALFRPLVVLIEKISS
jgi:type II secretory pathway component PulF